MISFVLEPFVLVLVEVFLPAAILVLVMLLLMLYALFGSLNPHLTNERFVSASPTTFDRRRSKKKYRPNEATGESSTCSPEQRTKLLEGRSDIRSCLERDACRVRREKYEIEWERRMKRHQHRASADGFGFEWIFV